MINGTPTRDVIVGFGGDVSEARLSVLSTKSGIWECTFVGECSVVCPKDVDPAAAIQNLKVIATIRRMRKLLMPKSVSR